MTLFVGGVHAVGKTTALAQACSFLGIKHATASQLIKEYRGNANWSETRQVSSVDENQRTLIAAIKQMQHEGAKLVVDGHFVLRKAPEIHQEIAVDVFSELGLRGILLLEAPSQLIHDRLLARGDLTWTLTEIEEFARRESEHASAVSLALNISLTKITLPSPSEMKSVLATLFSCS